MPLIVISFSWYLSKKIERTSAIISVEACRNFRGSWQVEHDYYIYEGETVVYENTCRS